MHFVRTFSMVLLILVLLGMAGCDSGSSVDGVGERAAETLFGDPTDERFIFTTYIYDYDNEESPAKTEEFPDPDASVIQKLVLELPWDDPRYSVSATVGQGTIWLPDHKIASVSANAQLAVGGVERLHAEITERKDGNYTRRQRTENLNSPEQIAELLISYMHQGQAHDDKI